MSKQVVLIVEDDADIRLLLQLTLQAAGFEVLGCEEGWDGLRLAQQRAPDLIVLDLTLPDSDGFEICRELKRKSETRDIPVLMLTARAEEVDRIVGLELGADDYVTKPFSPRELTLRIKAILKRGTAEAAERSRIARDGLVVDMEAHKALVDDVEAPLTATEFRLLAELINRPGRVLTRDQLLNTVWGYDFEGYARTVDTHVRRLRQKMGPYADLVETVRGVGYRFKE